jgi:AraC-like DNA-binding protein
MMTPTMLTAAARRPPAAQTSIASRGSAPLARRESVRFTASPGTCLDGSAYQSGSGPAMRPLEPTLTARAILPLVSGLQRLGHNPKPFLDAVGLDAGALDDPDARIPMSAGSGLLVRAAEMTGDDCIGLHLAEHADLRTADVHYYAMAASATLRDAFTRLSRYQRLIHETTRIEVSATADGMALRHVLPGGFAASRQTAEFLLAAWVRIGRVVTGTEWCPADVRFAHEPPAHLSEHRRFFKAPLRFSTAENALTVSASTLLLPCVGTDPALASLIDRYAREHMQPQAGDGHSLADRVRAILIAQLPDGEPTAAAVAARMKMSVRTLNRALAADGTTYRAVLDQMRGEMARRHLANPRTTLGEVAFLLGFSDVTAFHRAFRRWTGRTPAQWRERSVV